MFAGNREHGSKISREQGTRGPKAAGNSREQGTFTVNVFPILILIQKERNLDLKATRAKPVLLFMKQHAGRGRMSPEKTRSLSARSNNGNDASPEILYTKFDAKRKHLSF